MPLIQHCNGFAYRLLGDGPAPLRQRIASSMESGKKVCEKAPYKTSDNVDFLLTAKNRDDKM